MCESGKTESPEPEAPESECRPGERSKCFNCDADLALAAGFCHQCGQKNSPLKISLGSLVVDFVVQQFSIEGRLFRTLKTLLLYPGKLTSEYCAGKRARYLSPIHLYLLTSLLFFLLLDTLAGVAPDSPFQISTGDVRQTIENSAENEMTISFGFRQFALTKKQFLEYYDAKPEDLDEFFERQQIEIDPVSLFFAKSSHAIMQPGGAKVFVKEYFKLFSQTVLVLMPVLGMIIFGLYRRRSEGAVQCILFSAHVHSFAYVAMVLVSLFTALVWENQMILRGTGLGIFAYFVWAQKTVFGGSLWAVLAKSFLASILYFICVLLFVVLLLPVVFLLM